MRAVGKLLGWPARRIEAFFRRGRGDNDGVDQVVMVDGESREATMCPPSAGVPMEVEASNDTTEPVVIKDLTFQYTALSGLPVTRNLDLTLQVWNVSAT